MSAKIRFVSLFFVILTAVNAATVSTLTVSFVDIVRNEKTWPTYIYDSVSLKLSGGNAYISDEAVGVRVSVSVPQASDTRLTFY